MGSVVGEKIIIWPNLRQKKIAQLFSLPLSVVLGWKRNRESLMQMAKISAAVQRHSKEKLFYSTVLTDQTTGGVSSLIAK